jgi:hypothetical protein
MANLQWDGDDFRNEKDSSGATADLVSHSGKLQQGYRHGSLTDGLIAYYPMEKGEGEILHDGALDNTVQINGATWTTGQVGNNSLNFDASSVDKVNANELDPFIEPPLSISFWIKPESMGDQVIFDHDGRLTISTGTPPTGTTGNDEIGFGIYDGSSWNNILTGSKSSGSWYHIVSLYDGTNMRLYVNGAKVGTNTSSKLATKNEGTELGARGTTDPYNGLIEDFRVYNRIISQPEIQALYNLSKPSGREITENTVPNQDQGGISRYRLDGDVTDSWGNNDGTDNTSAGYSTGVYGQAKDFDGTDDEVVAGSTGVISDASAHTVSVWFCSDDNTGDRTIWNSNGVGAQIDDGVLQTGIYDGSSYTESLSRSGIQTGKWYHLVTTFDGNNTYRLYLNGSQDHDGTLNPLLGIVDELTIGATTDGSNNFDGAVDDIRIYNQALTPRQVEKLYHKGAHRIPRRSTLQ